jgi:streptogramin lyase
MASSARVRTDGITVSDSAVWAHDKDGYLWRIDPQTNTIVGRLKPSPSSGDGALLAAYGSIWIVDWPHNLLLRAQPQP